MTITWLFRKQRKLGNFSIENSFSEVSKNWPDLIEKPNWQTVNNFSEGICNRFRIVKDTRQIQTDILHITGDIHFAALAWPKWSGKRRPKVVLTIHDLGFLENISGFKRWMMCIFWIYWPLRCIDHLITVSKATKTAVLQEAPWFNSDQITVIPSVVPQHFRPISITPYKSIPVALHIGVARNKNLMLHAKALKGLNVHLRIIGGLKPADITRLNEMEIDYSWQPHLSDEEMLRAYSSSSFLMFASTLEGFGMPIIEAQMCDTPVITSNLEPMLSVSGAGGAIFVNPMSEKDIRSAVVTLLQNESTRRELIKSGRKNAERYHPQYASHVLQELYKKLC